MPQIFNGSLVDGLLDALAERLLAVPELIDEYTVADVRWYLESLVATDGVTDVGSDRDVCDESIEWPRCPLTCCSVLASACSLPSSAWSRQQRAAIERGAVVLADEQHDFAVAALQKRRGS
mmetsp:Transcript_8044/g.16147  ORF Transcript_8044/g.16147 Transcript_8044/m.16147 type:complete len:121 (+) Transcript_8044:86-448(+)